MRHFIIVKFDDSINAQEVIEPIKNIFNKALDIEGIRKVEVNISNTKIANRHDLMIEMSLTKESLELFDNSEIHKTWKDEYGKYIVNKTIFDCD